MTVLKRSAPQFSKLKFSKLSAIACSASTALLTCFMLAVSAEASVLVRPTLLREGAVPSGNSSADFTIAAATSENIFEVTSETLGFSTLTTAIEAANISSILAETGPITVFAPTDTAFAGMPSGTLEKLLLPDNRDLLVKLLYNHVAYGDLTSDQLPMGQIDTFDSKVNVAFTPTGVAVNEANIVQADIDAANGVIHAVDQVLLPTGLVRQLQARSVGLRPRPEDAEGVSPASVAPSTSTSTETVEDTTIIENPAAEEVSPTAETEVPVRALW